MMDRSHVVGIIREALIRAPLAEDYADEQRDLQPYVQTTIEIIADGTAVMTVEVKLSAPGGVLRRLPPRRSVQEFVRRRCRREAAAAKADDDSQRQ